MYSCPLVMTTARKRISHLRNHTVSPKYDTEGHVEQILVNIIAPELQSQRKQHDVAFLVT